MNIWRDMWAIIYATDFKFGLCTGIYDDKTKMESELEQYKAAYPDEKFEVSHRPNMFCILPDGSTLCYGAPVAPMRRLPLPPDMPLEMIADDH